MRLRSRLLLLVALLVSAALAISFLIIFRAVRRQTLADLDRSLESAQHVWESLSRAQAESLATTTSGMAAEAGFVQVLRQTDRATLLDYLRQTQENNPSLNLLAVYDENGQLRVSTEPLGPAAQKDTLLAAALEGQVGASFWQGPKAIYLSAASPIYKQENRLEGVLLLGMRLDAEYVEHLAHDTNVQVALLPDLGLGYTTSGPLLQRAEPSLRLRQADLPDYAGRSLGRVLFGRDLNDALSYMHRVYGQLFGLGLAVVGAAFLVSIPLVGRMTNPVRQLEKTQAEMDAVFQANVDGLVGLDQNGSVVQANPAAAVCFGVEASQLTGRNLRELLPEGVYHQLVGSPPSAGQLVQRCSWLREGRSFQLTRTFVASQHREVGSVLVTRELTSQVDPHHPAVALQQLQTRPESPEDWLNFDKLRGNLLWSYGLRPCEGEACWSAAFEELGWPAPLATPETHIHSQSLRLLLLNLWPGEAPELSPDDGGWWLTGRRVPTSWEKQILFEIVQEYDGRLHADADGRPRLWLPQRLPC